MPTPRLLVSPSRVTPQNTIEKFTAPLDARSVIAMEWTQHWFQRHRSLKATPAVVIRCALQVLADHLSSSQPSAASAKLGNLREVGRGAGSALTLAEGRARLERHATEPTLQPMAHWHDMLHSIDERRQAREAIERTNAFMASQFPEEATTATEECPK